MRTIRINLGTLEHRDRKGVYIALTLLAALVVCLSLLNIRFYGQYRTEVRDYERKISDLGERGTRAARAVVSPPPVLSKKETDSILEQSGIVNRWIAQDIYPWDHLLDELETCTPPGMVLLRFASAKEAGRIRIEGKAASMNEVTEFLKGLDRSKLYKSSILLSVGTVKETNETINPGAELPIRFEIDTTAAVGPSFIEKGVKAQAGE